MKKITALLLASTCALTFIHNSFGMLIKTSLPRRVATHKKIRSFHTSKPARDPMTAFSIFACIIGAFNSYDIQQNQNKLEELIEQNKENNELLRTIVKQNYINLIANVKSDPRYSNREDIKKYTQSFPNDPDAKCLSDLQQHYHTLREKYDIEITHRTE